MTAVDMLDAIRTNARNVAGWPGAIAGYGTGSGDVPWTAAEWDLFPGLHVVIDQSPPGGLFAAGKAHVYDMENLAGTPQQFPLLVRTRMAQGITWSTGYGTDATLAEAYAALVAAGPHGWFFGHVDVWLADWNLSRDQAAALIGREVRGMTCRAVQWASPVSNPGTPVPGTSLTLATAKADLSVKDAAWLAPAPPPPPPPATWQAQALTHAREVVTLLAAHQ